MSSSLMRVPDALKERLERERERFNLKTQYDVIDKLFEVTERQQSTNGRLQRELDEERERQKQEGVRVGKELKSELMKLGADIGLNNPADVIEFLIANYDGLMDVSKLGFAKYVELKGRRLTMKRILTALMIAVLLLLAACKADKPAAADEVKLTATAEAFAQPAYTARVGQKLSFVYDSPDLLAVEIRGLNIKVDKQTPKREVQLEAPGVFDIVGNVGGGKTIKAKLTVQ